MDVDAVEQGAIDAFLVAGDGGGRAATFLHRVAIEAAGVPVQVAVVMMVPGNWFLDVLKFCLLPLNFLKISLYHLTIF